MQIRDSKKIDWINTVFLYVSPLASVGIYCLLLQKEAVDALSNIVLALLLAGVYFTFLHVNKDYFYQKISHRLLYFGSFFLSFVLLGMKAGLPVGAFWMLAVVVAALDCGIELAVATHVALMVQYTLLLLPQDDGFYRFSGYLLLGLVIALLFSLLKGIKEVPYLMLILAACDGILQFVMYRFSLVLMQKAAGQIAAEISSVLVFGLLGAVYLKKCAMTPLEKEQLQLQKLTEPDFELIQRLQSYSQDLLQHSMKIAVLSEEAAAAIGGDAMLAKASGLYHEIGRIEDENDYIEAGTRIGQEYDFPEKMLAVMRQHSTGFEFPKSMEAAVVMLSDCIISTSDYLEKSGKRNLISDEHLVRSIFQNRLEKGNLQYAKMTEEQIVSLRNFYENNAFADIRPLSEQGKGDISHKSSEAALQK